MTKRLAPKVTELELQRAAAFRAALRRFLARTDEVAGSAGLTPQRYDLLLAIKSAPDEMSTVTELSSSLSLQQTAVTELVKRTEDAGLIERSPSAADGRVTLLALTVEGERRLLQGIHRPARGATPACGGDERCRVELPRVRAQPARCRALIGSAVRSFRSP